MIRLLVAQVIVYSGLCVYGYTSVVKPYSELQQRRLAEPLVPEFVEQEAVIAKF